MSLPLQAVDRLFDRLSATYGRDFLNRYEGMEPNAIKAVWAHELSWYANRLTDIAWALENLPERAPNAIEFRNLCRKAPQPETPRLPEPPADPERVKRELAKLGGVRHAAVSVDKRDWARRLVARAAAGERVRPLPLRMAREALANKSQPEAE